MKTAVLLLAYGGPDSLEDIGPYLLDVRGGRPTSPELVHEISERYARIGGRSPLLEITRAQAKALEARLAETQPDGSPIKVFVGMRHWKPYIADTLREVVEQGYQQVIAICMAPHASNYSTGAYKRKLDEALASINQPLQVHFVESWHDQPDYIQAVAENVRKAAEEFPPEAQDQIYYLFSAHSLPAVVLEQGDPYPGQLAETYQRVADQLGLRSEQWSQCYQSKGNIPGKWLGPQLDEVIPQLAERGVKNLLVVTPGFVADHVEVLYDLDVEAAEQAEAEGISFKRAASPNNSPTFINALAQIVINALQQPAKGQTAVPSRK